MADHAPISFCGGVRRIANRVVALILLPVVAVLAGFWFLVFKARVKDGGAFLYRGERLGKDKKPFRIYKLRTLVENAEARVAGTVLLPGVALEIPGGRFLRDTRLDELPQLLNVLKGDMDLVGPRPVRTAIYRHCASAIPGYDERFHVRPGLTGYSQLLTGPRTPKRIRSLIDNHFVHKPCSLPSDLAFVALTVYAVGRRILHDAIISVRDAIGSYRSRRTFQDLRGLRRVTGAFEVFAHTDRFRTERADRCAAGDINYYSLAMTSDRRFRQDECLYITLRTRRRRNGRPKCAKLHGFVYAVRPPRENDTTQTEYVIFYTPASELQRHMVDQYMLDEALFQGLAGLALGREIPTTVSGLGTTG